jgi:hypothetical protein
MAAADKEKQKQDVKASEVEAEDDNQPAERELKDPGRLKRSAEAGTKSSANMDFLLDIPLEISVELGRTKMLINELLKLGHGRRNSRNTGKSEVGGQRRSRRGQRKIWRSPDRNYQPDRTY